MRGALLVFGPLGAVFAAPTLAETAGGIPDAAEARPKRIWVKPVFQPLTPDNPPAWLRSSDYSHTKRKGYVGPSGVSPETVLAIRLGVLQTRIGIRAEQFDAWRDYTDALQHLAVQPDPGPIRPAEGNREPEDNVDINPFPFEERLIDNTGQSAAIAERLKSAIAVLRTKLTVEQQNILASTELFPGQPLLSWNMDVSSEG